jgi:O-antigen/teichoic acid export membrane protein
MPNILKRNRILVDGALYLLIESINRGLPLVLLPYITHKFSKTDVGLYSTLLLVISYLYVIVTLSAHASVNRYAGLYHGELSVQKVAVRQVCQILVGFALILSTVIISVVELSGLVLQPYLFEYLILTCFCGFAQSLFVAAGAYFRATSQNRTYFWMNISNLAVFTVFAVVAILICHAGVWALVAASGIGASVAMVFLHQNLGLFRFERIPSSHIWEVVHFGWPVVLTDILSLTSTNVSRIFLATTLGMITLAPYHVAFTVASIISIVVQSLNAAYVPQFMAAHFRKTQLERVHDPIFLPLSIAILVCAVLVVCSGYYVPIFFTSSYGDVAGYIIYPASAFSLLPIYFCLTNILSVDEFIIRKKPIVMLISTSVSILAVIVLSRYFGITGALLAAPIGGITAILASYYMVHRYTVYRIPIFYSLVYVFSCLGLIEVSRRLLERVASPFMQAAILIIAFAMLLLIQRVGNRCRKAFVFAGPAFNLR